MDKTQRSVAVVRLTPIVRSAVERILRGDPEAEDVVQDSLTTLWLALPTLRDANSERAFARAIARNAARDHLQARARRRDLAEALRNAAEAPTRPPVFEPRLRVAIIGLPPSQRDALVRRLSEGMKLREIAEQDQVPIQTIVSRLRLALQKLRLELREPARARTSCTRR